MATAAKAAAKAAAPKTGNVVLVGCKLPNGIILDHPLNPAEKVEIAGLNKTRILGATHATTPVDAEFWQVWSMAHRDFGPLKSGALFVADNEADLEAKAEELAGEKTGLEQMPQGDKAAGITAVDKDKE